MWKQLGALNTLFEYNGDAIILVSLFKRGELQFSDLARAIVVQSGTHRSDALLTKNLPRLVKLGWVIRDETDPRHPIYRLGPRGHRRADVLAFVADQMLDRYGENLNLDADEP